MKRISKPLKVGAVARSLGISPAMIRSWEVLGLTTPARTGSRYRLYTEDDLRVLRRATHLRKHEGLNTPAILMQLKQEGLLRHRGGSAGRHEPSLGPVLRRLRLQRGTPLSEVAQAVGVSKGFLSNLERSRCRASSEVLRALERYFRVADLSSAGPLQCRGPLLTSRDRKTLPGIPGVRIELLALGSTAIEPHLFHISPGAGSREAYAHKGEEFIYLIRGLLEIEIGGGKFKLRAGDAFSFSSTAPHRWRNPAQTTTVALWITTPAAF